MELFGTLLEMLMRFVVALVLVPVFAVLLVVLVVFTGLGWVATGIPFNVHATYPDWR